MDDHNLLTEFCIQFKNIFPPYIMAEILSYVTPYDHSELIDRILSIVERRSTNGSITERNKRPTIGAARLTGFRECRVLHPTEYFNTSLLTVEQESRLNLLKSMVTFDWDLLFSQGLFIAGGAALFVLDDKQCLEQLGDIDIWVPYDKNQWIQDYLQAFKQKMIEYYDEGEYRPESGEIPTIQYGTNKRTRGVTGTNIIHFATENSNIQFLLMKNDQTRNVCPSETDCTFSNGKSVCYIEELLLRFDYDVNQCAIKGAMVIKSPAFDHVLKTRKIKWVNMCNVNLMIIDWPDMPDRPSYDRTHFRRQKICNKGFSFGGKCFGKYERKFYNGHSCGEKKEKHECHFNHHNFSESKEILNNYNYVDRVNYILLLDSADYKWQKHHPFDFL